MQSSGVHVVRLRVLATVLLAFCAACGGAAWHASSRARLDGEAIDAFVRRTGSSELALSSTSRWLRHPALAEPGAACQDQPPCLDVDPAGLAIAPPRARWSVEPSRASITREDTTVDAP
ncbi:MAG: hypothetical protein OHK0013_27260 [Sandaracinaceae bacterium]